jgi:DNA-binding NtrC family response regulator
MDRILATSGYPDQTLAELRRHWDVIDIRSQRAALEYLQSVPDLPTAAAIGLAQPDAEMDGEPSARVMIQEILRIDPTLPVIISTGARDPKTIVDLVKLGAFDYVVEPRGKDRHDEPAMRDYESRLINAALARAKWRLTEAAALLGMKRTTLHYRIKHLGLDPRRRSPSSDS